MKYLLTTVVLFCVLPGCLTSLVAQPTPKLRVLVLSDMEADVDDSQSMVRFLAYANEFDIEGLMATIISVSGPTCSQHPTLRRWP